MSMGIAQEICNKVMSEVQGIKDTGFPLDAFPEKVQTIILDMVRYENFKVEYLAPAMLSAVSSALGGTCYVRVKGQWITNAALYTCGESHLQFVTKQAMHGAIKLMEYFEDSYCRIREYVANDACDEPSRELLSTLNDSFTTAEALAAGKQLRVTDRTVMNYLKELAKNRLIKKIRQWEYQKTVFETQQMTTSEKSRNVNCNE